MNNSAAPAQINEAITEAVGEILPDHFKEITYRCADEQCGNEQVIRYFANLQPLPVTCCVKCRAGFGKDIATMIELQRGMFPVPNSERSFPR